MNKQTSKKSVTRVQTVKPVNEPVTLHIQNLSHESRGVALYDERHDVQKQGKKVFVRYALPDEVVVAQVTQVHKRFEEADMLHVVDHPSPYRVEPVCPYFGRCGGCAMQHIQTQQQIVLKQQVLASHLQHFAGLEPEDWLPPIYSTQTDYRRRARLGVRFRAKQQQWVVGFREAKSNYLVDLETCSILDERVSSQLSVLKQCLAQLQHAQAITHIEFALGDDEIALLIRHVAALPKQDIEKLLDFVKNRQWQLYLQADGAETLKRIDVENATMRLHYRLAAFDLNLAFSPLDFTQVNAGVNQQMVQLACQLLDLQQGDQVLDLFCGLGNFSLPLAKCVGATGQVIAVEAVEEMVRRGEENARRNHLHNIQFYRQDLMQDFSNQPWAVQGFDALLIDPPRAGAEQVMHYVANFAAKRIVYVSCNPATLARDAGILVQQGYRLVKVGVMDMFTHTEHVESIALFERI